jgi:hypothetical protein
VAIPTLGYVHLLSFLFPAFVGIRNYAKMDRPMRLLTLLCIFAVVNIVVQFLLGRWGIRNHIVSDYYRVLEVSLLCGVFWLSVTQQRVRKVMVILAMLFVLAWFVDLVLSNGHQRLNNEMAMTSRMVLLVMSLTTLYAELRNERTSLAERSVFWVSTAVALYTAGTFLVLAFSNYLLVLGRTYFDVAWHINWALLIAANLMYTKGMMCKPQA